MSKRLALALRVKERKIAKEDRAMQMNRKNLIAGGLALTLSLAAAVPTFASGSVTNTVYGKDATQTFKDIKANTEIAQVLGQVLEANLMSPEPNGDFAPNSAASTTDFSKAIVRYLGLSSSGETDDQYVSQAETLGLLPSGTSTTGTMSRLNVALAFAKALKLTPVTGTLPWKDASNIPSADQGLLLALYQKGYFKGFTNGDFGGSSTLTREQIAFVFARLLGQ